MQWFCFLKTAFVTFLAAVQIARELGGVFLSLPTHYSHRIQPRDVALVKPFYTYMGSAIATNPTEK
jgi:hypothetical protein